MIIIYPQLSPSHMDQDTHAPCYVCFIIMLPYAPLHIPGFSSYYIKPKHIHGERILIQCCNMMFY